MSKFKQIFAILFASIAIILMNTAVFAEVTGSGTEDDPYMVETYDELVNYCRDIGGYIKLKNNVSDTSEKSIYISNTTVHLDLNNHSITKAHDVVPYLYLFYISDDGELILDDSGSSGKIFFDVSGNDPAAVYVAGNASFTMNGGSIISNSVQALYITGYADAVLNNGSISANYPKTSNSAGGAVKLYHPKGSLTINYCDIDYSTVNEKGNGLLVYDPDNAFKMRINNGVINNAEIIDSNSSDIIIKRCLFKNRLAIFDRSIAEYIDTNSEIYINGELYTFNGKAVNTLTKDTINIVIPTRTLTYYPNGGTGKAAALTYEKGETITLESGSIFTAPEGKVFTGWKIGNTVYKAGAEYTVSNNTTAYAQWGDIPVITKQPTDQTVTNIGWGTTFSISGNNIKSYKWHLLDKNGNELSFDKMEELGYAKVNGGVTTNSNLYLIVYSQQLNGYQLYCTVTGNDYSVDSNKATLNVGNKIPEIYAEIENFENAVHGHNIEEFRKVTTPNSFYTASDAAWYMFQKNLGNTEIYLNETYGIRIEFDALDGYEFSDSTLCHVGNVKGETVRATRITGSETSTHRVYYFEYTVPAPEGGIIISTVKKTVDEPVAGNAPADAADQVTGTGGIKQKYYQDHSGVTNTVWTPNTDTFEENTVYTVEVTLATASSDYVYTEDTEFYINDNKADVVSWDKNNAVIRYTFVKPGDVDLNGTVNDKDAALLLKYLSGTVTTLNEVQTRAAYVNDDTEIDMRDVVEILKKITA